MKIEKNGKYALPQGTLSNLKGAIGEVIAWYYYKERYVDGETVPPPPFPFNDIWRVQQYLRKNWLDRVLIPCEELVKKIIKVWMTHPDIVILYNKRILEEHEAVKTIDKYRREIYEYKFQEQIKGDHQRILKIARTNPFSIEVYDGDVAVVEVKYEKQVNIKSILRKYEAIIGSVNFHIFVIKSLDLEKGEYVFKEYVFPRR